MTVLTGLLADDLVNEQGLEVVIPDIYTSIGEYAFNYDQLTSIVIPDSVISISEGAFRYNKLTSVVIPDSVISIGEGAFRHNKLTSIVIPDSVTSVGPYAFRDNLIENVAINENVSTLGNYIFDPNVEVVNLSDGKVIGPSNDQYNVLQGVLPGSAAVTEIVRGKEKLGTRDVFLLPNNVSVHYWLFDTGFADSNDYFLIDSKVDINKVAQFANCIWYDEEWEGEPLIDTRNNPKYENYDFSKGEKNFEMAWYRDWEMEGGGAPSAPKPSQFGTIDFTGIDLNLIGGMSDDAFLKEYAYVIDAFDPSSGLSQATGNPTDLIASPSKFDENISSGSAVATLSSIDPNSGDTHSYSLVSGAGDADNSAFTIVSDKLTIKSTPKYQTKESYSIRLQTEDSGGLSFQKAFTFTVNDPNENPTPTLESTPEQISAPIEENIIKQVISIDDISTPNKVSTFELKDPFQVGNEDIDIVIIGTKKKDKITGTSEREILAGQEGKNVFKGGGGSDGFLFNSPKGFGKKQADTIKDFDPNERDSVLVEKDVFGLGKKIKLKVVAGKKAYNKAAKSNNIFVYDEKKGFLYFNENGKEKGWGDGGLFAKLQGAPELGESDFAIV